MCRKKTLLVLLLALLAVADTAAVAGTAAVVRPDRGATVDVARFLSADRKNGAPAGWELEEKAGVPLIVLERSGDSFHLRMKSDPLSSFGVKKAINVNIKEYPFLNWRWKAGVLPRGGDVRNAETDDQALQVYIAFPATGFPAILNTPVLAYIWDNEAPRDWTGRSPQFGGGNLRYRVLRNRRDAIGRWTSEKCNIYQDYRRLFPDLHNGEPVGPAQGISLYINSQHTGSAAEGSIADIFFSRQ